jgi:hypothetical protein
MHKAGCLSPHLIQVLIFNSASTPIEANMAAAIECTSLMGIFLEKRSPTNTAGTSAISMPSVVPMRGVAVADMSLRMQPCARIQDTSIATLIELKCS